MRPNIIYLVPFVLLVVPYIMANTTDTCAFCSDRLNIRVAWCEEFHRILSTLWSGSACVQAKLPRSNDDEVTFAAALSAPRTMPLSQELSSLNIIENSHTIHIYRYTLSVENNASTLYTHSSSQRELIR